MTVNCTPTLINNTIARNRATQSYSTTGAGLYTTGGTSNGRNNIVYDNVALSSPNVSGTTNFTYSCVGGGLGGTGNISSSPMFIHDGPAGYFYLSQTAAGQSQTSPCVDAGQPASAMITGSTRTDGVQDAGVVDMGYHWRWDLVAAGLDFGEEFSLTPAAGEAPLPECSGLRACNHPNPFNPATTITLVTDLAAGAELSVYDAAGRLVETLYQGDLEAGSHAFRFSGTALPAGIYLYRARVGDRVATGKALLIK